MRWKMQLWQSPCAVFIHLPSCRSSPWSREPRAVWSPAEQTSSSWRHLGISALSWSWPWSFSSIPLRTAPELWLQQGKELCCWFWHCKCLINKNIPHEGRETAEQEAHGSSTSPKMILLRKTATCLAAGQRSASGRAEKSPTLKPRSLTGFTDLSLKSLCWTWNAEIIFF